MLGKGIIYWNLQWEAPLGWMSDFTPLGEGELLSLHWEPSVLLQAGPAETHYTWNGTHTIGKGGEYGELAYPTPSPSPHAWQYFLP